MIRIGSVIAVAIVRVGSVVAVWLIVAVAITITVIAAAISTAILSSPVADLFKGDITFRYRRRTSYT
jgi:hypothetical protein